MKLLGREQENMIRKTSGLVKIKRLSVHVFLLTHTENRWRQTPHPVQLGSLQPK